MSWGSAFSNAFLGAYQMMSAQAEREKERQAASEYFNMLGEQAQKNVQPFEDAATRASLQAGVADSNLAAASAPITTSPDRIADTRSTRFLTMTPQERLQAGLTQAQSDAIDKQMQGEGPVNMQQVQQGANGVPSLTSTLQPVANQANNQQAQLNSMLAQAKERYGSVIYDKLGAMVENGFPVASALKIAEGHVAKAEETARKEQMRMNVRTLSDKNATPEQKQAVLAQLMIDNPSAARGLADAFGLKQQDNKYTIAGNGQVVDMRTGLPVPNTPNYMKPEKPEKPAAGTWILQTNADGSQSRINTVTGQVINVSPAKETIIDTPLGKMTNTQLLARLEAVRPKTIETTDEFGNKVTKKDGDVETYNVLNQALKNHMAKQQGGNNGGGSSGMNDLTPDEFEEAKKLKALGLNREQVENEIAFRRSGAKSR